MSQVPEYKVRLKHIVDEIRQQAEQFEKTTETVLAAGARRQELRHRAGEQRICATT